MTRICARWSALIVAVIVTALSALVAIIIIRAGLIAFLVLSYAIWIAARAFNFWFGTKRYQPFMLYQLLTPMQKDVFKMFALYLRLPALAMFFSMALYWLRFVAVVWLVIALWYGFYWECGLLGAFVLLIGKTLSTMLPDAYIVAGAKKGNRGAIELLEALRRVQAVVSPD
jgi:hypothetical protein